MKALEDEMFGWIRKNRDQCAFNLTNSGFPEPDLTKFGINTEYRDYMREMKEIPEMFREEVARIYHIGTENVMATCGGTGAIFLANAYFRDKTSTVYVPPLEYMPMFLTPQSMDMSVIFRLPEYSDMKKEPILFEFTNPNNPTGLRIDDSRIGEIMQEMDETGGFIYADETFRHFSLAENPGTIFNSSGNIIVSNTMTKFYGIGNLRIGWMIANEDIIRDLSNLKDIVTAEVSSYSLWIAVQILRNRGKFIQFAGGILKKNMSTLARFIHENPRLECDTPEISSIAYIRYDSKIESVMLSTDLLKKTGVLVVPGKYFHGENGFRVCMTSKPDVFAEAMERISRYLSDKLRQ